MKCAIRFLRKHAGEYGIDPERVAIWGTSSGANIWACKQMAEKYGKDKVIATVLPDRMERYFSTGLL